MKIKVERCWGGGAHHYFRVTLSSGQRENMSGEVWNRYVARDTKNMLSMLYGFKHENIRFQHVN